MGTTLQSMAQSAWTMAWLPLLLDASFKGVFVPEGPLTPRHTLHRHGLVLAGPELGLATGVCAPTGSSGDTATSVEDPYVPPRHRQGNNFAFVDGHVRWLPLPGGVWIDGGPWTVPDMSMYSRTGRWEPSRLP